MSSLKADAIIPDGKASVAARLLEVKQSILSEDESIRAYREDTVRFIEFNSKYTAPNDLIRAIASLQFGVEKILDELGIELYEDDRDAEVNEVLIDIVESMVSRKGAVR